MASMHKETGKRPGFRIRWRDRSKNRSLWLGTVSNRSADTIFRHVSELIRASENNTRPETDSERWADALSGKLREKLVGYGLAKPALPHTKTDAGRLLTPFLDAYIVGRTDLKPGTKTNYEQARRLLVECFGADRALSTITPADADRFRRWMLARVVKEATDSTPAQTMAVATVSKYIKRTKTMFNDAVRDCLLDESPLADQKGGSEANKARHHFVDRDPSAAVLDACPTIGD